MKSIPVPTQRLQLKSMSPFFLSVFVDNSNAVFAKSDRSYLVGDLMKVRQRRMMQHQLKAATLRK